MYLIRIDQYTIENYWYRIDILSRWFSEPLRLDQYRVIAIKIDIVINNHLDLIDK